MPLSHTVALLLPALVSKPACMPALKPSNDLQFAAGTSRTPAALSLFPAATAAFHVAPHAAHHSSMDARGGEAVEMLGGTQGGQSGPSSTAGRLHSELPVESHSCATRVEKRHGEARWSEQAGLVQRRWGMRAKSFCLLCFAHDMHTLLDYLDRICGGAVTDCAPRQGLPSSKEETAGAPGATRPCAYTRMHTHAP